VTLVELNVTIGYDKLRLKVTIRNVDNVNVTIRDIAKSRDKFRFVTFRNFFVTIRDEMLRKVTDRVTFRNTIIANQVFFFC
jgi:hypothetical protein